MSRRLYPHKRVRYWYAYDIDDVCSLFADLNLHKQTVRKWIKSGLATIDMGKPALIYGQDLIIYLKQNNSKNKCKTTFNGMFCMACQDARHVFQRRISVQQKTQFLQVQAVCRECKGKMFKNYKLADFSILQKQFQLVDVLELYDDAKPSGKTHIQAQNETPLNESSQGELF